MIDQVTLDRVKAVRDMIAEYEHDIDVARGRLDALRLDWATARLAADELAEQGDEPAARRARLRAHELQHKVEMVEEEIDQMEQLLAVFRRKLDELQRES